MPLTVGPTGTQASQFEDFIDGAVLYFYDVAVESLRARLV